MTMTLVTTADLDSRFFAMDCGRSVRHDADVASLKIG
jgi:hypothetical protein